MRRRSESAAFQLFSFQDIITSVMGIVIMVLIVLALELSQRQLKSPARQHAAVRRTATKTLAEIEAEIANMRAALANGSLTELAGLTPAAIAQEDAEISQATKVLEINLKTSQKKASQLANRLKEKQEQLESTRSKAHLPETKAELERTERTIKEWQEKKRVVLRVSAGESRQAWLLELGDHAFLIAPHGVHSLPVRFEDGYLENRTSALITWTRQRTPSRDYFHILVKPGGVEAFGDIYVDLMRRGFTIGFDLIGEEDCAIDPTTGAEHLPATPEVP